MNYKRETLYKTTDGSVEGNFFINRVRNDNAYEIIKKGSYFNIRVNDSSVIELAAPSFRIGEVVRIKTKEEFNKDFVVSDRQPRGFRVVTYSNFQPDMNKFCGKEYKISHIASNGAFHLVDGGGFYFDPDMLVKVHNVIYEEV